MLSTLRLRGDTIIFFLLSCMKATRTSFLLRAATAGAVVATFGVQLCSAALFQNAVVVTKAKTTIISANNTNAANFTAVTQVGGFFGNQTAAVPSTAVVGANSTITAVTTNTTVVNQQ